MTSLEISNKLCAPNARDFQLSLDGGVNWENHPCGDHGPLNLDGSPECRFKIDGPRVHDSSIAISLKGFTHTVELVDKCQGSENYVLLRFVPKPIGDANTSDIGVKCLPGRVAAVSNNSELKHNTSIQFRCFKYSRNAILKKCAPGGVIFTAQYSCQIQDEDILIGELSPNETFEIYLEGARPNIKTIFRIIPSPSSFEGEGILPREITFTDDNNIEPPHITAIVTELDEGPGNINITIQGDET
ncbi:MAG TPA: hypothetical protein VK469_12790 [Candidatus Kapabacteria bacterium]|nr:hypothetical protein [Candidatus Kapabacteria bacterium]